MFLLPACATPPPARPDALALPGNWKPVLFYDEPRDEIVAGEEDRYFGADVAGVGDVNGDGYPDVAVGAYVDDYLVYVYRGSASGLVDIDRWALTGDDLSKESAAAGDVDGDGFDDILVSPDPYGDQDQIYVFAGAASGPESTATSTVSVGTTGLGPVAALGDADGDGFDDVLVAMGGEEIGVFAGSTSGLSSATYTTVTAPVRGVSFGGRLAGRGDLNGDGYPDAAIAGLGYDKYTGQVHVYLGSSAGLSSTPDHTLTGAARSDWFGDGLAIDGDIDADGFDDLVVGASGADEVYVYPGSAAGPSTSAATVLTETSVAKYGAVLDYAGDVNGDGFDDLVAASEDYGDDDGHAWIYLGSSAGLSTTASTTITGSYQSSLGDSAAGVGDVDQDGFDDVLLGTSLSGDDRSAYLHGGSAGGVASEPTTTLGRQLTGRLGAYLASGDVDGDGYSDGIFGEYDRVLLYRGDASGLAEEAETSFVPSPGTASLLVVASGGDVNGDGFDDVAVGGTTDGDYRTWIYPGSTTGLPDVPSVELLSVHGLDFGSDLSLDGDIDGDGFDDALVAEWGEAFRGRWYVHVFAGSAAGLGATPTMTIESDEGDQLGDGVRHAGDVDGDGFGEILVVTDEDDVTIDVFAGSATGLDAAVATSLDGVADFNGKPEVAGAGDVDGDGYADVLVGANAEPVAGRDGGLAALHLGSPAGLSETAVTTLYGESEGDSFGSAVAGLGDSDADGYDDVAIGAEGYGPDAEGAVYVYGGSAAGLVEHTRLVGDTEDRIGRYLIGAGDIDADGCTDVFSGGMSSPYSDYDTVFVFRGYADRDADGFAATEDCDDADAAVNPDAAETCNEVDDDCDGTVDDGVSPTWYADTDGDGFGDATSSEEACDALTGFVADATDCDDAVATISPLGTETCNLADDDCDGAIDEDVESIWYADTDGDGFGDATSTDEACDAPTGFVADATDCDDTTATSSPGGTETCNLTDDDCDGAIDEDVERTWYADTDGDGFGDATSTEEACDAPIGFVADATDCDDATATTSPAGTETCNLADNDCDGAIDEDVERTWYADTDRDGFGDATRTEEACDAPIGFVADATDCDDAVATTSPGGTETCNLADDDCDGATDEGVESTWYADTDGDGFGDVTGATLACDAPAGFVADATDCDDAVATSSPSGTETCNLADDDCDGAIDEDVESTWYADTDGDGYGDAASTEEACDAPTGFVADATDCDDAIATTSPAGTETCNMADDDCDGVVDEDVESTWYADTDGDGYGDAASTEDACDAPTGFVADATDCDDTDSRAFPGAQENPGDGIDQDCDGDDPAEPIAEGPGLESATGCGSCATAAGRPNPFGWLLIAAASLQLMHRHRTPFGSEAAACRKVRTGLHRLVLHPRVPERLRPRRSDQLPVDDGAPGQHGRDDEPDPEVWHGPTLSPEMFETGVRGGASNVARIAQYGSMKSRCRAVEPPAHRSCLRTCPRVATGAGVDGPRRDWCRGR